jgi:iron complex transport system substrate-binding protein
VAKVKSRGSQRRLLSGLIIIILVLSSFGCKGVNTKINDNTDQSFRTVTDDLGRKVSLKAEPERIVSLAPSNTEILFYLGLGDRVVGDTTYCDYPEEAKLCPKVGGFEDPSLEKIVALKPDLVLATDMHQHLLQGLEDAGLNILVLNPHTLEEIFADIQLVGKAAGVADKADDLTRRLKDRVAAVSQKTARVPENQRPTVYYEMWYQPLISIGRDSLIAQMIELAGGKNITDDCSEPYPQLSEEVIIDKDPEVMFNSYGHDNKVITTDEIAARKGWKEVACVKTDRIYTIDSDLLTLSGPRIVEGLEKMAEFLHPELFKSN